MCYNNKNETKRKARRRKVIANHKNGIKFLLLLSLRSIAFNRQTRMDGNDFSNKKFWFDQKIVSSISDSNYNNFNKLE